MFICIYILLCYFERNFYENIYVFIYILLYYVFYLDEINEYREYMYIYSENKIMKYVWVG